LCSQKPKVGEDERERRETPRSEMVRGNCTSGQRLRARRIEERVRGESGEDMRGARAR
jgi:hypothetical protein